MAYFDLKDPDSTVDYSFNWDDGYLQSTASPAETISTSSWSISPSTPSPAGSALAVSGSPSKTTTTTTAFVTNGVAGRVYRLTNEIVTNLGRTDDRSWIIRIGER